MNLFATESVVDRSRIRPERSLLVAVLERAVFDFVGHKKSAREDAAEWIFGDYDNNEPFSFNWVCSHLDMHPADVLHQIKQMKPRGTQATHQWWADRAKRAA